ncbi:tetratricopeptide repeat protein 16 isoform X5 [Panthera pardus]|uniref:Tetratricopeptide repeat protein 16 isoform X5 n=1 Tax=Panthera pardus TaxID=9691 RepID=A0A9W2W0E2_PANPR|nr:tetratricopeptide repeat protein 16 isoform X5 [Panthera pardus]
MKMVAWMSSRNASLLSLGVCLPAQPCLSTQASLLPTHLQLQLYALGWPKSGPAPLCFLPPPPPQLSPRPAVLGERGLGDGRAVLFPRPPPELPADFYALRAEAYIQLCDFSSAALNLRRAYSFQPENAKYLERLTFVLYLQGQCLLEQHAFLDALKIFSQASALQPEKASFRYRCMACLLALKRHQDCLSLVTKEVQLGTTNADIYILRARLYNFFQKPSLCYRDLHRALLLDPKHPQAKVLLKMMVDQAQQARQDAGILAVQGKLHYALQRINCAIENNPLDPGLFLFRGIMYRRLWEFDAAVEDILKALDMMSERQEDIAQQAQRQLLLAYNDFAVHCYMQGAYQEGVLLLNKALRDEQQEKGLYINRGDCFFQLGNLTFAEADYQQALALSPQDEGANIRMGLLQEKMGFCEHRSRQFHKAESHFSVAIQHNPRKAQYYLHRARSRQLLQNILGARLDVATVLLLNPKQPKLLPLMTNLFPGMSVEEVLGSQAAHLARLQLDRVSESSPQAGIPQGIVGRLRERERERHKARALQLRWKQEQPSAETSEELKATTPQTLEGKPEGPKEEAEAPKKEEKQSCATGPRPPTAGDCLACLCPRRRSRRPQPASQDPVHLRDRDVHYLPGIQEHLGHCCDILNLLTAEDSILRPVGEWGRPKIEPQPQRKRGRPGPELEAQPDRGRPRPEPEAQQDEGRPGPGPEAQQDRGCPGPEL